MTAPLTDEQLAAIEARLADSYDTEGVGYLFIQKALRDIAALLQALRAERAEVARWKETSESWRASAVKWQHWAGDLLDELGRQPIGGQHGDEPARELIAQLAGLAPGVPRCECCGCFATRHDVDDEELRACADCECSQYLVQP